MGDFLNLIKVLVGKRFPFQLIYSNEYWMVETGKHVFPLQKYRLVYESLLAMGAKKENFLRPRPAPDEDILLVHIGGGFHHAFPDHGEGFCLLNDVAVAARKMIGEKLAERVMVVDCDLHQGNGTAAALAGREDIFTLSIHQMEIYPMEKALSP